MRKIFSAFLIYIALVSCEQERSVDFSDYVSTLTGTQSDFSFSSGNTYPATAVPWGMNFWTPQTAKMGDGWVYNYSSHKIRGFKQTHQPSPWINDYGQFSIMPVRNFKNWDEENRASWFSHQSEVAKPYFYSVYLADHDILAEMTPTERAAILRFTFPESGTSGIIVDAFDKGSWVKVIPEKNMVVGYSVRNSGGVPENFKNYFAVVFDTPFCGYRVHEPTKGQSVAVLRFDTERGDQVEARVASSFISSEQALLNLAEVEGRGFDSVKSAAKRRWDEMLGRIAVTGGSQDQMRTFYSCLYRSLLFPRKFYEINAEGKPVHYSPYDGQVHDGYLYTDTGFWDTFRSLFPLLNLAYPDVNKEIQAGLANIAKENAFLPEWASPGHRDCMVGNNSASVVADAAVLGVNTKDLETLYNTILHGTTNVHPTVSSSGRLGHEYYNSLGYVPYNVNINENVARTLEYCYNDWCILQLAKKLHRPQEEQEIFAQKALNYRNVFDPTSNLMRGRNSNGAFQMPFSPYKWGDAFTEGNAWHYTWSVFHDVQGLIDLMGGDKVFTGMLDSVFVVPPIYDDSYYGFCIHEIKEMQVANMGNYAHGNQPAQHMTYLYNYAGEPWKTQRHVRDVMNRLYSWTPNGYCGDEDNGQTSAWYVFSALGFYPVCPGSGQYVLGAPLFKKAVITRPDGAKIKILARNNSDKNLYIKSMRLNGSAWTHNFLDFDTLTKGARLDIKMSSTPNKNRGIESADRPYSFSKNN